MRQVLAIVFVILCAGCRREAAPPTPPPASSATGFPDNAWIEAEISPGKKPRRLVISKDGWRSGPDVLVIDQPAEVTRTYAALAGNERIGFTCGYHWQFLFEYANAAPEAIDINEECEQFRRRPKETWAEVKRRFDQARKDPSHHAIHLLTEESHKRALATKLGNTFGVIVPTDFPARLMLISKEPWTEKRIERLREACASLAKVDPIEESDTGN